MGSVGSLYLARLMDLMALFWIFPILFALDFCIDDRVPMQYSKLEWNSAK